MIVHIGTTFIAITVTNWATKKMNPGINTKISDLRTLATKTNSSIPKSAATKRILMKVRTLRKRERRSYSNQKS